MLVDASLCPKKIEFTPYILITNLLLQELIHQLAIIEPMPSSLWLLMSTSNYPLLINIIHNLPNYLKHFLLLKPLFNSALASAS